MKFGLLLYPVKWIVAVIFFLFIGFGAVPCSAGQLPFTLESPAYSVSTAPDQHVLMEGYGSMGVTGAPDLPMTSFWAVLPPDIYPQTLSLTIDSRETQMLPAPLDLAPASPMGSAETDKPAAEQLAGDSENSMIYLKNALFPLSPLRVGRVSRLKGVNLVRIFFIPIQYNPVTKEAEWTRQVQFHLSFDTGNTTSGAVVKQGLQVLSSLTDPILNKDSVSQYDLSEIAKDYTSKSITGNGYAVFTTDAVKAALYDDPSGALYQFASHKVSLGYAVYLVTESQSIAHSSGVTGSGFGSETGQQRALNIRSWLTANHAQDQKNIKYVLLIGNPDPDDPTASADSFGDLPMLMCFTGYDSYGISITMVPTDYFFAELSGNWDLDGDGLYGEFTGDSGSGGVEFLPEVYVGRIPFQATAKISDVLNKTMAYENVIPSATDNSALAWRKKTLLPMSILNFGTSMWGGCSGDGTVISDEAYLGRSAQIHLLHPNGFDTFMMTEQDGDPMSSRTVSPIPGDGRMAEGIDAYWNGSDSFGVVMWSVHGSSTSVSRKYYPDSTSCPRFDTVFSTYDANDLDDNFPAFMVSTSCNIGYPEKSSNLAHELMENGTINIVAGSRTLLYVEGDFSRDDNNFAPLDIGSRDLRATAYYYTQGIANDLPAGDALFIAKQEKSTYREAAWVNNFGMNLYGDPALKILPPSFSDQDSDGDGLSDDEERYIYQSDPTLEDSDGDGVKDGEELVKFRGKWIKDYDGDGLNLFWDKDSDNDGIQDKVEVDQTLTDPFKSDSDNDGLSDFFELNQDGEPSNYTASIDFDPNNPDTDADGVNDGDEVAAGQNPLDPWDNKSTAQAGPDISVDAQAGGVTLVSLDGSGSSDPNNDPLFYFWNVENSLSESYPGYYIQPNAGAAASTPTLYAPVGGDYNITLKVREDDINQYVWSEPDTLTVHVQHKILSVLPETFSWGDTVILSGLGFDKDPLQNTVTFGGVQAQVAGAAYDELQVIVPEGASGGYILVTVNDKLSNPFPSGLVLPPGAFYPALPGAFPEIQNCSQAAAMGDIDGDGDIDIVVANMGGDPDMPYDDPACTNMDPQNRLYLNDGSGIFFDATFGADGVKGTGDDRLPVAADQTVDIKLADIDSDGDLDMVAANAGNIFTRDQEFGMDILTICEGTGGQNRVYINNGTGFFTDETSTRLPVVFDPSTGVSLGDINGDTYPDLVFANASECTPETELWPFEEECCYEEWCSCCEDCANCQDNPGCQPHDIPESAPDKVYVNDGAGNFIDITNSSIPGQNENFSVTHGLSLGDMDGDGDLDMIRNAAWGYYSGIYLFENMNGVFSRTDPQLKDDGNGKNILLADFNKDPGFLTDIFISHPEGYYPTYLIGLNDGSFENHSHYSTDDWLPLNLSYSSDYRYGDAGIVIDADLDGDPDVVIGRSHDQPNQLFINDDSTPGHFTHTPGLLPALSNSTYGIAAGDVNNDGSSDLFFANVGRNRLLLNAATGEVFCAGDFNEDSDIDGQDLYQFIENGKWSDLNQFAGEFGGNCP